MDFELRDVYYEDRLQQIRNSTNEKKIEQSKKEITQLENDIYGLQEEQQVADAWLAAMQDVIAVKHQNDIPELNKYQCGTYAMHSLEEAKLIATEVIQLGVTINHNNDLHLDSEFLAAHS